MSQFDKKVQKVIKKERQIIDFATIRFIDGDKVDILIGSSANLIRGVQVIGGVSTLIPGSICAIVWIDDRPVVLSGLTSSGVNLSIANTNRIGMPGTLSVFTDNEPLGDHTHEVDASDAPGTTSKILKTDTQGHVTVDSIAARCLGIGVHSEIPMDMLTSLQGVVHRLRASHAYSLLMAFKNTVSEFTIGLNTNGQFDVSDAGNSKTAIRINKQTSNVVGIEVLADGKVRLGKDSVGLENKTLQLGGDFRVNAGSALLGSQLVYNGNMWVPGPITIDPNTLSPTEGMAREKILYGETYPIPDGYAMVTDELDLIGALDLSGGLVLVCGSQGAGEGGVEAGQIEEVVSTTKLDDLALPDDNTDLNATAFHHGLMPKLSGVGNQVLSGDGTFIDANLLSGGFIWRGDYASLVAYSLNDIVYYEGSTYVCIQNGGGNLPTNMDYFRPWAIKGGQGDQGIQGLQGEQGVQGVPGENLGIEEALQDGKQYARKDAGWVEVVASGGGAVDIIGIQVFS